ncbi:platelet-activating factor acetylhydrolase IB subunit gamma-like [Centruroides sculpturatus]|uniref:platelet-activating factor acetylhydrolase IB subunit gamma-like n=1 Tax=Centruroides sculpturatus TaxID=218467 RepID=UPI000C6E7B79|nr:platelet-activating factor acetylhydrolase IB subunit gamma-like [Centruroides sculpturatus]
MNPAATPTLMKDQYGDDWWMSLHKRFLIESTEQEPDVLFIGDFTVSMIAHTDMWEKLFIGMHCLNFGIAEDQTQHVLWRIENGEIDTLNPKIVVLGVGTNNHDNTVEQILEGIHACVKAITARHPSATVVVVKLFPSGQNPNPVRKKIEEVNKQLEGILHGISQVQVVNLDPGFVQIDGTISHHDMYDYRHLTRHAARRAYEPLADLLQQLICERSGTESASYD